MTVETKLNIGQKVPVLIDDGVYICVIERVYTSTLWEDGRLVQNAAYAGTATRTARFNGKEDSVRTRQWGGTDEDVARAKAEYIRLRDYGKQAQTEE